MLKIKAKKYIELGEEIGKIRTHPTPDRQWWLRPNYRKFHRTKKQDQTTPDNCVRLMQRPWSFRTAADLICNHCGDDDESLPNTGREYNLLIEAVYSELKSKFLFYIPQDKIRYYDGVAVLSEFVKVAFPAASEELALAGCCYATELSTACVYHCMRALESGLRALAADVGLTWTIEQWQKIINDIEGAIKSLGNTLPKGQAKKMNAFSSCLRLPKNSHGLKTAGEIIRLTQKLPITHPRRLR